MEMNQVRENINQDQQLESILAAVQAGNVEELRIAVDAAPNEVNTASRNGLTPLYLAVKEGSLPCVKLLVSKNANVKQVASPSKDVAGPADFELSLSPFLLACRLGHQSIVEFLFYNGADPLQTSVGGDLNCLSLAITYNREETSKFLVTHTEYETLLFLMKTVSHDLTLGRRPKTSTPMRQLIQHMPDVAEIVMDRCIKLEDNGKVVTCYLELLDDFFSPWARKNNDTTDVFDAEGELKRDIQHNYRPIKDSQHPLALMQEQERHAHLLTHPLSIKLIENKWRLMGFVLNLISLALYFIFLFFLTGYVLVNPPSFYIMFANKSTIIWYYEPDKLLPDETYSKASKYFFGSNSAEILLTLVVLNIIKEIFQMYSQGSSYFNYQSILEWSIYVLTFALAIPVSGIQYEEYELREKWQWQCGAVAILMAWINLTLYVRQTSTLGIYVIMFEDVLLSTVQFMVVILLFMVAFALAFNTLLLNQTDFHSIGDSLLRTFAMTTGELDFTRIFHSQNYLGTENVSPVENYILTSVFSDIITNITFVAFVITMPIIAMNLLVGVAVDDIHRIRQKAAFYFLKLKVDRVISAENMILGTPLRKCIIRWLPVTVQKLKIKLSHESKWMRFRYWFSSVMDIEKLQESVREVCMRNDERQELRTRSSLCSQEGQPDGGTNQNLLQKLRQMRDEINSLINQVERVTA